MKLINLKRLGHELSELHNVRNILEYRVNRGDYDPVADVVEDAVERVTDAIITLTVALERAKKEVTDVQV